VSLDDGTLAGVALPSLRLARFFEFALEQLPSPPARVLEVGCGRGDLARALAEAGYAVVAIDPQAPDGAIFRQTRLEDFADEDGFDAVVASVSLHHLADLDAAFDKIAGLLREGGVLVVEEFAKERLEDVTARWYFHQRQARAAVDGEAMPDEAETWLGEWRERHADVHPFTDVRRALDARFVEVSWAPGPYLFDHWLDDAVEPLERKLIEAGAIEPCGVRYVGRRP
jgi:ubiquinone/menaquinone biosynthesis C-methylase UbiE